MDVSVTYLWNNDVVIWHLHTKLIFQSDGSNLLFLKSHDIFVLRSWHCCTAVVLQWIQFWGIWSQTRKVFLNMELSGLPPTSMPWRGDWKVFNLKWCTLKSSGEAACSSNLLHISITDTVAVFPEAIPHHGALGFKKDLPSCHFLFRTTFSFLPLSKCSL